MEYLIGCIGLGAFFVIALVVGTVLNGWALHLIWNWFIPVIFQSAPELSIGHAIAVSMVIKLLTQQYQPTSEKGDTLKRLGEALMFSIFYPLFVVGVAFILKVACF